MNTALWVIQIILAIKLVSVAFTHGLRRDQQTMQEAIQKMGKSSRPVLNLDTIIILFASLGLVLPGLLKLSTPITAISAASLAVLLLVSIYFHARYRQKPNIFVSVILFALATSVAYGRWVLVP